MYIICQNIRDTHKVFDRLAQPDVKTFSALLVAYERQGCVDVAKKLINEIGCLRVEPNVLSWNGCVWKDLPLRSTVLSIVLSAVGDLGNPKLGIQIHGFVIKEVSVGNGPVENALEVFRQFESQGMELNVVSWTSMVAGFSQNGKLCMAGLVDEGCKFFDSMCKEHGIEARMEHYACMVTLLDRVGRLEEAYNMIGQSLSSQMLVFGELCLVFVYHHFGNAPVGPFDPYAHVK
ncbi:pentatricopeptide repeat-containing protein At1g20230-like [Pistacia vera]|uniref:pentatricopeptide repeat-containing protein At1g20230-like n=1 Tax=Pistacia vera TaxID=55513 RepID=UPI001262AE3A|nr:pentatricopeptide repeat-containing protein At1g20230-like [Pistacia vera]